MKPTAKAYLESVREAVIREQQLSDKVETLTARLDGVGAIDYSRDNVAASSDGKALERRVMLVMDARHDLDEQRATVEMMLDQAAGMLRAMAGAGCPASVCDELEYYYLWGMSTREISRMVHLSESRLRAHRIDALAVSDGFVPLDAA